MSIHFLLLGKILFQYAESEVIMDLNMNGIGERIKQRRKELGLSQIDIYNKCDITSGALSKIENGKTTPSIIVFYKLSQILQCDMDWLATGCSSNLQTPILCKQEKSLLNGFRELSSEDQEEFLEILNLKLRKAHRVKENHAISSQSMTTDKHDMVG